MNKQNQRLLIVILVFGFVSLACGFLGSGSTDDVPSTATPTATTSSGEVETGNVEAPSATETPAPASPEEESPSEVDSGESPSTSGDGPASINLDDPDLFNQPSNVQTYRTSLETTFSATATDGAPVNGAVYVEGATIVDANASNLTFQTEGNADLEGGESMQYTQIADMAYIVAPDMDCLSISTDTMNNPFETFLDTGGDLNGEAYRVQPDENVNGVDVYVFEVTMENMASLSTEITELKEGRIYVAKDGFYVVRMRFVGVGTDEFLSGGSDIEGDILYALNYYDFNQPIDEIVPPEDCTDLGADDIEGDYPLPDDAYNFTEMPGVIIFYTELSMEEIEEFYQTEMTVLGCAAGQGFGNSEGMLITFDGCPSGTVQVSMAPDPASGAQQVSIISMP